MRNWVSAIAFVATAACHAAPATPKLANEERRHEDMLALVRGHRVQFVAIAPPAVAVARTVDAPATVMQLRWSGEVPVVLLSSIPAGPDEEPVEGHDDEIGRITAHGYERVPAVPEAAWGLPAPDPDHSPPRALELHGDGRSVYVARCERGGIEDGGWCEKYVYAEVVRDGAPVLPPRITRDEPGDLPQAAAPHIAPSPALTLELVDEPSAEVPPSFDKPRKLLRCTRDGVTTEYPARGERESFIGMGPITWLATDPPLYQVTESLTGYDVIEQEVTFEGCAPATAYAGARLAIGPSELVALFNDKRTSVRQLGRELATFAGASIALFRPAP